MIDRPVEDAFAYFSDFANRPRWIGILERVIDPPQGAPGTGMRWQEANRMMGRSFVVDVELVDYVENQKWIDRVPTKPVPLHIGFTFEPVNGGTRIHGFAEPEISGPLRLMAPLVKLVLKRQFVGDMRRLKSQVESATQGAGEDPAPVRS